jgi:hypothetical protein
VNTVFLYFSYIESFKEQKVEATHQVLLGYLFSMDESKELTYAIYVDRLG